MHQTEFLAALSLASASSRLYAIISMQPSAAVFQAERRISRGTALLRGRSLVPLVKARDFGMTPSNSDSEGIPLPLDLWNHRVRGKSRNNLCGSIFYGKKIENMWLACAYRVSVIFLPQLSKS